MGTVLGAWSLSRLVSSIAQCSLGLIISLQAFVLANHRDIFKDIKIATAGILFLGTPHQGSSAAEYGIWLARALGNDTALLETLKKNSSTLLEVAQDFENSYSNADIVCFYEKKDGPFGTQVCLLLSLY